MCCVTVRSASSGILSDWQSHLTPLSTLHAGHAALLHACTVEDGSLIGMGATLCDGSKVQMFLQPFAASLSSHIEMTPAGTHARASVRIDFIHMRRWKRVPSSQLAPW